MNLIQYIKFPKQFSVYFYYITFIFSAIFQFISRLLADGYGLVWCGLVLYRLTRSAVQNPGKCYSVCCRISILVFFSNFCWFEWKKKGEDRNKTFKSIYLEFVLLKANQQWFILFIAKTYYGIYCINIYNIRNVT